MQDDTLHFPEEINDLHSQKHPGLISIGLITWIFKMGFLL